MFDYRVKKYIGAYAAAVNGVDILVFTGQYWGIDVDKEKNSGLRGKEAVISSGNFRVTVMVVPTNEELVSVQDAVGIPWGNKK